MKAHPPPLPQGHGYCLGINCLHLHLNNAMLKLPLLSEGFLVASACLSQADSVGSMLWVPWQSRVGADWLISATRDAGWNTDSQHRCCHLLHWLSVCLSISGRHRLSHVAWHEGWSAMAAHLPAKCCSYFVICWAHLEVPEKSPVWAAGEPFS